MSCEFNLYSSVFRLVGNCFLFFILSHCFHSVFAQLPLKGRSCPNKTPPDIIDLRKMTGQWYEIESSPELKEWVFKCISIKVTPFYEKKAVVKVQALLQLPYQEGYEVLNVVLNSTIPQESNGKDGLFMMRMGNLGLEEDEKYQVLATDYDNWAIIWSCSSYTKPNFRKEDVWVVSRTRTLASQYYKKVRSAMTDFHLEGIRTHVTSQEGCLEEKESINEDASSK